MSEDYEVGYKKPPEEHKFKPGCVGNPGGLTSEQAAKRKANRDKAFAIEEKMLAALAKDMTDNDQAILGHIRSDVLRLIHTAIEREDGKPVARQEHSSPDGSMSPHAHGEAVLEALRAKRGSGVGES